MAPASTFFELGAHVGVHIGTSVTSGLQFDSPGCDFSTREAPLSCFFDTFGRGPEPSEHFDGKELKRYQKHRIREPGGEYFNDM